MKRIAKVLHKAISRSIRELFVSLPERQEDLKGLRFYLDYCFRYQYLTRDQDRLSRYLGKLSENRQFKNGHLREGGCREIVVKDKSMVIPTKVGIHRNTQQTHIYR